MYHFDVTGYQVDHERINGADLNRVGQTYVCNTQKAILARNQQCGGILVQKPFRGTRASTYLKFSLHGEHALSLMGRSTYGGEVDPEAMNVRIAYHFNPFLHITTNTEHKIGAQVLSVSKLTDFLGCALCFCPIEHNGLRRPLIPGTSIRAALMTRNQLGSLDFRRLEGKASLCSIAWGNSVDMEDPYVVALGTALASPASVALAPVELYTSGEQSSYGLAYVITTQWECAHEGDTMNSVAQKFTQDMRGLLERYRIPNTVVIGTGGYGEIGAHLFTPQTDMIRLVHTHVGGGYNSKNMIACTDALVQMHNALCKHKELGVQYAANLLDAMEIVHRGMSGIEDKRDKNNSKRDLELAINEIKH